MVRLSEKIIKHTACALAAAVLITGCGSQNTGARISKAPITNGGVSGADDGKNSSGSGTDLYVVEELDTTKESLTVFSLQTGNRLRFDYNYATEFYDRYGNYETWSKFVPGTIVTLGTVKTDSTVKSVSDYGGFRYDNISDYTLDPVSGVLSFAKENFILPDIYAVLSDGESISVRDVNDGDVISVIGEGRNVYCLVVTESKGVLKLTHTEKFDGSVIEIGSRIFAEVERNGEIDVPEGTYTVTVANEGYGGSAEIEIYPGETTTLDLSTLEGKGPKTCRLSFRVANDNCNIFLDGKRVENYTTEIVKYGTHTLVISADGYDTWKKYLVVNSASASIEVGLDETDTATPTSSAASNDAALDEGVSSNTAPNNTNTTGGLAGSLAGSMAGNAGNIGNTTTTTGTVDNDLEYYSTLSNLISTLLD